MTRAQAQPAATGALRFSASVTFLCADEIPEDYAPVLATAGFTAVEFQRSPHGGAARHVSALREAGLSVALLNIDVGDFVNGGAGLVGAPHREDEFRRALEQAYVEATTLGARVVNVGPGRVLPGLNRQVCLEQFRRNLRLSCETFAPSGIQVAVEALNNRDYDNLLIRSPEDALELIAQVDHPSAVLQYDIYHAAVDGRHIESDLRRFVGQLGHVQFADLPGRHEPGSGVLAIHDYFALLAAVEYRGCVGAEYSPTGRYDSSFSWLDRYRRFNAPSFTTRSRP